MNTRPLRLNVGAGGRSFVGYLFSNPNRIIRRERMYENFWPDAQESEAKKRLNNTLSSVRRLIEKNTNDDPKAVIYSTHEELMASPTDEIEIDAVALRSTVEKEWAATVGGQRVLPEDRVTALKNAVHTYTGHYLEECDALWLQAYRGDYFTYFIRGRMLLLRHYIGVSNYEDAIEQATKILEWDDSREMVLRDLLRLLVTNHQRATALVQYEKFVNELKTQHGLDPMPVTQQLRQSVIQGQPVGPFEVYARELNTR